MKYMGLQEKGQKLKKIKILRIITIYVDGIQNPPQKMIYIVIYGQLQCGNLKRIFNLFQIVNYYKVIIIKVFYY